MTGPPEPAENCCTLSEDMSPPREDEVVTRNSEGDVVKVHDMAFEMDDGTDIATALSAYKQSLTSSLAENKQLEKENEELKEQLEKLKGKLHNHDDTKERLAWWVKWGTYSDIYDYHEEFIMTSKHEEEWDTDSD